MNLSKLEIIFCLCLPLLLAPMIPARAAESEDVRKAELVAGAKKEGSLLWYSSMSVANSDRIAKRFMEKYPFVKVSVYRGAAGMGLVTKILSEARAKRYLGDVNLNSGLNSVILQRAGIFAKYPSPERKFYPEASKDPEGYWTDTYVNLSVIAYNTRLVASQEAPKSYEELLDPKWKGKIGMDNEAFDWFYTIVNTMGRERGLRYMEKLAEQRPIFSRGTTLITQLLAAGETSIAVSVYNYTIEDFKKKGAAVDWVNLPQIPIVSLLHPIAVSASAPHPHAARLFVDFVLSKEGQELMASFFLVPTRSDVEPLIPKLRKGINIIPWDPGIVDNYEKNQRLVREIFVKKR